MKFLTVWTNDLKAPVWRYIINCFLVSFIPSILLLWFVSRVVQLPPAYSVNHSLIRKMVIGVVFAPFLETLLLGAGLEILRRYLSKETTIAFVSALVWSALHMLIMPYWGIFVFWPFLVFSFSFLARERVSRIQAIFIVTSIHALHNLSGTLLGMLDCL